MKAVVACRHRGRTARQGAKRRKTHFEFVDAGAQNVLLVGSFNAWKVRSGRMTRLANGKWVKDLDLAPGAYEYRYVVDGHWVEDPNADHAITNVYGERNSLLSVPSGNGNGHRHGG
jgi:1,4-alpha-glucan branching enzyme